MMLLKDIQEKMVRMILFFTILCAVVTALFFAHTLSWLVLTPRKRRHGSKKPLRYFHLDPLLGLDLKFHEIRNILADQELSTTADLFHEIGNTFEINDLGRTIIRTIDPENVQAITVSSSGDWSLDPLELRIRELFVGRRYVTSEEHGELTGTKIISRGLLKSTRSSMNITDFFETSVDNLLGLIPHNGITIDLAKLLSSMFADTSTQFLFGASVKELSRQLAAKQLGGLPSDSALLTSFYESIFAIRLSHLAGILDRYIPQSMKEERWKKTHSILDIYINRAIAAMDERIKKGEAQNELPNLLSSLVQITDSPEDIRNQMLLGMMSTLDTTSELLSNTMFLLSRDPKAWDELRREVMTAVIDPLNANSLNGLEYLNKVLKESLRLYPVFPTIERAALRDTTLPKGGGSSGADPIFISKGNVAVINLYALHRNRSVFGDDVDNFNPKRWNVINPRECEYMPFGGAESWPEKPKAMAEASYTLFRLAQAFKTIESRDDKPWAGQVNLTARNVNGCKIRLSPADGEENITGEITDHAAQDVGEKKVGLPSAGEMKIMKAHIKAHFAKA